MEDVKDAGCLHCLYLGTQEKCNDPKTGACLGSVEEVNANQGKYLYRNFESGDGVARYHQFQNEGKRNIVIGGMGEAECNTQWSFEETAKHLIYVSEQCGYLTSPNKLAGTIDIDTHDGHFRLVFFNDRLNRIEQVITRLVRQIPEKI